MFFNIFNVPLQLIPIPTVSYICSTVRHLTRDHDCDPTPSSSAYQLLYTVLRAAAFIALA